MSLFGKKKTEDKKVGAVTTTAKTKTKTSAASARGTTAVAAAATTIMPMGAPDAIMRPRVTEKSGLLSQSGIYTFEVTANANTSTVAQAVKALYKVTPVKVAIINTPAKNVFVRGRRGVVSGIRKALVTLKKGEKIDFV